MSRGQRLEMDFDAHVPPLKYFWQELGGSRGMTELPAESGLVDFREEAPLPSLRGTLAGKCKLSAEEMQPSLLWARRVVVVGWGK